MLVVRENAGKPVEVFCYDNEIDSYQLNKIPFEEIKNGQILKTELASLLKEINDRWYQEKICSDFLNY